MKTIPNGVYPTMVTPFTDGLRVDYGALPPLLDWYERHDCAGVFSICSSSEITKLRFEERRDILRALVRAKKPGTTILASGHVETDPAAFTREAQAFAAEGPDAYVFILSLVAAKEEGEDILLRRLEHAAKALGDIPLGIYECPGPYHRTLLPETIRQLEQIGNFVFSKDTCCRIEQIKAKLAAATHLKIFNANTETLLDSLDAGCAGFSGVMGNFHPQLYAKLCECHSGGPALARRLQGFVNRANKARCGMYPTEAKYYLQLEGVPMGYACRCQDASAFGQEQKDIVRRLREMTIAFEQEIAK